MRSLGDTAMFGPAVDLGLLVLRLTIGITVSLHGFQKLFGWFGGGGPDATARWFASLGFGNGRLATVAAGTAEITGGLGLATGLLTPFAAVALVGVMTTAALVNHEENGFWSASKGWELNGYLIAVAISVAITGPGRWSLDVAMGLEGLAGPLIGAAVAVVGVGAGWLQWATRTTDDGPTP